MLHTDNLQTAEKETQIAAVQRMFRERNDTKICVMGVGRTIEWNVDSRMCESGVEINNDEEYFARG